MTKLQKSESLNRFIRCDPTIELGRPTWSLVSEGIKLGNKDEASELLNYGIFEARAIHDSIVTMASQYLTYFVNLVGEEKLLELFKERYESKQKDLIAQTRTVEESIQRFTEGHRGHQSNISITEEHDKYIVSLDPCGSGGRLRRSGEAIGLTKKAYPWAWNKIGVPYYCAHCCVAWEIIPIELGGYPIKIGFTGARPEDPCVQFFYKEPGLIPEEFYRRIGKKK